MSDKIIRVSKISELNRLHDENCIAARKAFENGQRIGELLTEFKAGLGHGQWLPWLKANTKINERTARNYMRIYRECDRLQIGNISDLTDAYNALTEHAYGQLSDATKRPRIPIKYLGIFGRALSAEDEHGHFKRADIGTFELLGIRLRDGMQAVEVCLDESRPEHIATFWFHCVLEEEVVNAMGLQLPGDEKNYEAWEAKERSK
jgi:Protein of unknown function (DUF3102)